MRILAEARRIDVMIVGLAGGMIVPLTWGMVGFGVNMLTEVCMIVVIVAIIASEVAVPVSYATGVRAGVMIDVLAGTAISVVPVNGISVLAGVENMWAVTMTALGSIPILASLEEALAFGWGACSCWPTAA